MKIPALLMGMFCCLGLCLACNKSSEPSSPVIPPAPDTTAPVAKLFRVEGSRILNDRGEAFIARGTNVNGPYWPWPRPTLPDVGLITNQWKCNAVRLNCWQEFSSWNQYNADMDAIVRAFTDRKVVVIIEEHQFTGKYPDAAQLVTLTNWWVNLAKKYKDNEYVWFNIMNEPGQGAVAPLDWLSAHETVIKAIRKAGAPNIIVCDEHGYGQGNGYASETGSGILTYGQQLVSRYKNIAFSLHLYSAWSYGEERLGRYVDAVQGKNLALMMGEYGAAPDISEEIATYVFKIGLRKQIGRLSWHWAGDDIHDMVATGNGGGYEIDNTSGASPGNLSRVGRMVWEDNRGTLTQTDPLLIPKPVIFFNPDFERGDPRQDDAGIEGWINFGTSAIERNTSLVREGRVAVRVKAGEKGGFGTNLYLEPGGRYQLSAWGKHSTTTASATSIGIKYTTRYGGPETELVRLDFTDTNYQQQTAVFTLPGGITSLFLYVWKNDAAPAFWADGFSIEKR